MSDPDDARSDRGLHETVVSSVRFVDLGGGGAITDLGVRLREDLVSRYVGEASLTQAEPLFLRLEPNKAEWTDALYLRGELTDTESGNSVKVRQLKTEVGDRSYTYPTVGIPRRFLRGREINGVHNPFSDARAGDHAVVRYGPEGWIGVFTRDVFNAHPDWDSVKAIAPIALLPRTGSQSDHLDLAGTLGFEGKLFEIVPFDACGAADHRLWDSTLYGPSQREFTQMLKEGYITPCVAPSVSIKWGTPDFNNAAPITERERTEGFRTRIPTHGTFVLYTDNGNHCRFAHNSSMLKDVFGAARDLMAQFEDDWWGRFFDDSGDGPSKLYVPV